MKHQYLEFQITHQKIERTDNFFVVGGSVNYLKARFSFCEDWAGKEQIAIFTGGGHSYAVSLIDGECFVPWEVLRVKRFYVGCMAGERITSNAVAVDVCPCAVGDNLESPLEPTPTVIDEKIAKAVEQYMKDHPIVDDDDGDHIYVQPDEPLDAPDGSFWINPDEEESSAADTSGFSGSDFDIVLTRDSGKKELAVICTGLDPAESYALHLYTVSRRRGNAQKKWQHHPNYDIDDSKMNIQRKGYGRIAGTSYEYVRLDDDPLYYPPAPYWMPNNGYLQTEWSFIPDENGVAKVIINPKHWLVPLLKPAEPVDALGGDKEFCLIGIRKNDQQSLHFKFRVVRLSDGAMSRLSDQTFSAGLKSNHMSPYITLVNTDSADTVAIAKENLHTSISVR